MLINHEVPLDLLETSKTFNDYDFILPRFWKKYAQYKYFYSISDKFKILDNGLFEGDSYSNNELISIVNEVKPNIFVTPDEWNDAEITLDKAYQWINLKDQIPSSTKLMIVLQGKTYNEIKYVLGNAIKMGFNHFALNHSSLAYSEIYSHPNSLISKMMGRIILFDKLLKDEPSIKNCYIHFLGASLPQELIYLYNKEFVSSIDTSNPIIVGIDGKRYESMGLDYKPQNKIETFMENSLASSIDDVMFNVKMFREWAHKN